MRTETRAACAAQPGFGATRRPSVASLAPIMIEIDVIETTGAQYQVHLGS
jgi:hypothetical protein